jgi:hypothetical protein
MFIAEPRPNANVKASKIQGVVWPIIVIILRPAAAAVIQPCVNSSIRRRSTMSASAAAGRTTRNTGRLVAVCMSATISGECESDVMSHTPPTFCIHVPIFETIAAIQRARKTGCRSGVQVDSFCRL